MKKNLLSIELTKENGKVEMIIKANEIIEKYFKNLSGKNKLDSLLYDKTFYSRPESEIYEKFLSEQNCFDNVSSNLSTDLSSYEAKYNICFLRLENISKGVKIKLPNSVNTLLDLESFARNMVTFVNKIYKKVIKKQEVKCFLSFEI